LPHHDRAGAVAQLVKERLQAEGLPVVPMTVFAKGAHYALEDLSNTPYDVVGLDWTMDPADAVRRTGGRVTLQGTRARSPRMGKAGRSHFRTGCTHTSVTVCVAHKAK
jgi:hypothetical protein